MRTLMDVLHEPDTVAKLGPAVLTEIATLAFEASQYRAAHIGKCKKPAVLERKRDEHARLINLAIVAAETAKELRNRRNEG